MSLETVERVIEVFGSGRRANYHWYSWGEPLLYKQFHEFIEIAKHVRTTISSNFSLNLTNRHFEDLSKIEMIIVSMSGLTPEVYNIYHQGGNFDLVMSNVKRLAGFPNKVRINWLQHPGNKHQEQMSRDWCATNGFEWGGFRANCEVEELVDGFTHPFLKTPRHYSGRHLDHCRMTGGWVPISVDGDYLLCCVSHNVKIGLTIWDNVTGDEIRDAKMRMPLCKLCREKQYWKMF